MKSGRLNKSCGTNGRDAVFGYGVYLTKMAPEFGKLRIAKNNWDGYTRRVEQLVDSREFIAY